MVANMMLSALLVLVFQEGIDGPRDRLMECLDRAEASAKSSGMTAGSFPNFIAKQCETPAANLRKGLIAFDTKYGTPKKQAEEDADAYVEDFMTKAARNYSEQFGG